LALHTKALSWRHVFMPLLWTMRTIEDQIYDKIISKLPVSANTITNKTKINLALVLYLDTDTKGKYMHRHRDKFSSKLIFMLEISWLTSQLHRALPKVNASIEGLKQVIEVCI
jgi:hypothetical protein